MSYHYYRWHEHPRNRLIGAGVVALGLGLAGYHFLFSAHHPVAEASSRVTHHHRSGAGRSGTETPVVTTTTTASPIQPATPPKPWTKVWNQDGTETVNQHFGTSAAWDWVANLPGSSKTYLWIVPGSNHGQVDWAEQSGSHWTFGSAPAQGKPSASIHTEDPVAMALSLVAQLRGTSGQPAFPNGAPPAIASSYSLNSIDSYSNVGLVGYQQIVAEPYAVTGAALEQNAQALAYGQSLQSNMLNILIYATANGQPSDFVFTFNKSGGSWVWDGFAGGPMSQTPNQSWLVPGGPNDGAWIVK